jgi:hypothetical protein
MIDLGQFQRLAGNFAVAPEHHVQFWHEPRGRCAERAPMRRNGRDLPMPLVGREAAGEIAEGQKRVGFVEMGVGEILVGALVTLRRTSPPADRHRIMLPTSLENAYHLRQFGAYPRNPG